MNEGSVSIIVPAYNEEGNLRGTIEGVLRCIEGRFRDYEILIFDDFSTDGTGPIADDLSAQNPKVRAIHNEKNMGFGYNYSKGVELASMDYVMMVPGDNEITEESVAEILSAAGRADIVVPYTANTGVRPLSRRIISSLFTSVMNAITGLDLKYYNGPCLHRSDIIKKVPMTTWGYAYMASILSRLIGAGHSYVETPMYLKKREHGGSKAFRFKNVLRVGKTLFGLFWEMRIKKTGVSP